MILKISKLQSSHYRNASTDSLGNGGGSLANPRSTLWEPLRYAAIISRISVSVCYRPISTDCLSSILRCFDVLTGCSWEFLSSRIWYSVAERVVTDVSKRREPFTERHSITPHTTIPLNPLNPELKPICYLLALLGAHHFLHVSRIRVKLLTFRRLMSYIYIYIYGAPILDVSRSHTTTQHSR